MPARDGTGPYRRVPGPLFVVTFEVAGATRQVLHRLGVVPSGYDFGWQTGAVYAIDRDRWTSDVALLVAPVANTQCSVQFYVHTEREEVV